MPGGLSQYGTESSASINRFSTCSPHNSAQGAGAHDISLRRAVEKPGIVRVEQEQRDLGAVKVWPVCYRRERRCLALV
jgi:hypothetical protein